MNAILVDSIKKELEVRDRYFENLKRVIYGEPPVDEIDEKDTLSSTGMKKITFTKSQEDSLLRKEIEKEEQFDLSLTDRTIKEDDISNLFFFPPLKGVISSSFDPVKNHPVSTKAAEEALKLKDIHGQTHILLVHGHQGSLESDKFIWLSRFFVRLYRGIEPFLRPLGLFATGSVTKSQVTKDYERVMYTWGKRHKVMLICGHSHRAIFASKSHAEKLQEEIADLKAYNMRRGIHQTTRKKNLQKIEQLERQWDDERDKGRIIEQVDPGNVPLPCYFNSGCGLYTDGITAIEIDDDEIRLVKWSNSKLFAQPRVVFNQGKISEFIEQIMR
jgi:hypothetical protein